MSFDITTRRVLAATVAVLMLAASGAGAQSHDQPRSATPLVGPTDAVYHDVDRLRTAGLLPAVLMGQRPFSISELSRLAALADSTLQADSARASRLSWAPDAISRLARAGSGSRLTGEASRLLGGGSGQLLVLQSSSPVRQIPFLGLGRSDALISTAAEHRAGLLMEEGVLAVAELGLWMGGGPLAVSASTRERLGADDPFGKRDVFELQTLSARLVLGNAALTIGRDQLHWAQAATGGLVLSANPRPVDQVILSMERPARMPWFLGALGPTRATLFVADMGGSQRFPNTKLSGYKITILPHDRLEIGASVLIQWGGDGAPALSFGETIRDHVPFLDAKGGGAIQVSNKLASLDGRLRLHDRTGLTVYGELAADDLDKGRKLLGMYEDGAQLLGLRLPSFGADGRWDLQVEARRTGLRFYNHHQFQSGLTVDGAIIGDPLGPNALAGGFQLRRGLGSTGGAGELEFAVGTERRSYDVWQTHYPPLEFERTEINAAEWRSRMALGLVLRDGAAYSYRARVAGERIANWSGTAGEVRWGVVSEFGMAVRF